MFFKFDPNNQDILGMKRGGGMKSRGTERQSWSFSSVVAQSIIYLMSRAIIAGLNVIRASPLRT